MCLMVNPTLYGLRDVRVFRGGLKSIFGGSIGHVALKVYKSKLFLAQSTK